MNKSLVDDEFIQSVINRYSDMIFRVSYQYVQNKQDAEDVLQEVLFELLDHLNHTDFQSDDHLKAWLIRVTINKSINCAKHNARRKKYEKSFSREVYINPQYDDLDYILSKLSATDKEVIYLRYYEGYSAKEIATIMNKTEQSIFKRMSRARVQLKNFISEGDK